MDPRSNIDLMVQGSGPTPSAADAMGRRRPLPKCREPRFEMRCRGALDHRRGALRATPGVTDRKDLRLGPVEKTPGAGDRPQAMGSMGPGALPRKRAATSVRRPTSSRSRILWTWFFTVEVPSERRRAISLFDKPSSINRAICC